MKYIFNHEYIWHVINYLMFPTREWAKNSLFLYFVRNRFINKATYSIKRTVSVR
jgi:hypothetical protein